MVISEKALELIINKRHQHYQQDNIDEITTPKY